MDLTKNPNDKLPEDTVQGRVSTYEGMMRIGYVWGLPIVLAIVMFLTLLLLDVGIGNPVTWIVTFLTWLGVLGFSKTFFVH